MSSKSQNMTPVSAQDAGFVVSAGLASGGLAKAGFPAAARVRAKVEFDRVFKHGKRIADPMLALHRLDDGAPPRLGLAVSRKVDQHAVGRNRIKRVLRDAFRHARPQLGAGAYVIVARPTAAQANNPLLRATFLRLLQRAGALPAPAADCTMPSAQHSPSP